MKFVFRVLFALTLVVAAGRGHAQSGQRVLVRTPAYTVYADSVVQGRYTGRILSRTEMTSDYRSPASLYKDARISFKFSINGKDNEMPSGTDHHLTCIAKDGICQAPLIKFGTQLNEPPPSGAAYLAPDTRLQLRLDMSDVFNAFEKQGYFTTFKGDKIYKEDFKGVYVAGSTPPLIWDFDNLVHHPQLLLTDSDGDHIYQTELVLNKAEDVRRTDSRWRLSENISAFPSYHSPAAISDALYNLSLEEMCKAVERDSTFRTGKEWAGVWTRDISYSIILSMAYMQPAVAMKSLLRKVNGKGRIVQDTGTGGAYPCSTDRMIWAAAAWEIYLATGDEDWLRTAYKVIRNSMEDDDHVIYDQVTGLVRGESSFLDWREQTYPRWMQPADIFWSECLGTNAVHFRANVVLSKMAHLLKDEATAQKRMAIAEKIRRGINRWLWMPEKGYYAQYLYGRDHLIVAPRWEALGEALCILWDIASPDQRGKMIAHAPMTAYGIPCIWPEIPDIPPYHNNAVWPFVETFWTWAAAKAGNGQAVMKGIGDIYRCGALFLTNKENIEADNGDYAGTQINSSNMLWSLSGSISLVHKVLFGLEPTDSGLTFHPFVPRAMGGRRALDHFVFRGGDLDIVLEGYGSRIAEMTMDGKRVMGHTLGKGITGKHRVYVRLSGDGPGVNRGDRRLAGEVRPVGMKVRPTGMKIRPLVFSVAAPEVSLGAAPKGSTGAARLTWPVVKGAVRYKVLKDGIVIDVIEKTEWRPENDPCSEYQVIAMDSTGVESFASEPVRMGADKNTSYYQAEEVAPPAAYGYKGFMGAGFIEVATQVNPVVRFTVEARETGEYILDLRYANGNGPTNTENMCAIRTLTVDGKVAGTVVLPQRGKNEWSNWGYSNAIRVKLDKGRHQVELRLEDFDENMNGGINQAMVDCLRVIFPGKILKS